MAKWAKYRFPKQRKREKRKQENKKRGIYKPRFLFEIYATDNILC